jgi:putative lumazine-binding protein
MKQLLLLIPITFSLLVSSSIIAQTKNDTIDIENAALNYIEGYFYNDAARMEKALHPELIKRSIQKTKEGDEFIINLGASYMIMRTKNNTNRHAANPDKEIIATVDIYDITGNAASVKVSSNQYGFIDYLHVGKYKGEWRIINVLWANLPDENH